MFDVGAETLALPMSEKMKYEQGDNGDSFGYVTHRILYLYELTGPR